MFEASEGEIQRKNITQYIMASDDNTMAMEVSEPFSDTPEPVIS